MSEAQESQDVVTCPHCGSTEIVYWERGTVVHGVSFIRDGTVAIGSKPRSEDIEDSGFECQGCDKDVPELDEYEKDFML